MTPSYLATLQRLPWLMDAAEARLAPLADGCAVDTEFLRGSSADRLATFDEASAVMDALTSAGLLVAEGAIRKISRPAFTRTASYRKGVRDGLACRAVDVPAVRLCAALPIELTYEIGAQLRRLAEDLRGAIVDIAAGARQDLILASPFWDGSTLNELKPLLVKRLESGTRVRILGRFPKGVPRSARALLDSLAMHSRCELLSWNEPSSGDVFNTTTFHFKTAIADGGAHAYLGTANFTASGLRSRLELGVLLEGPSARKLFHVVETVLQVARMVPLRPLRRSPQAPGTHT